MNLPNLKEKFEEYKRIILVSKKPSSYEFKAVLKITGIGTMIIGLVGFVIKLIGSLLT